MAFLNSVLFGSEGAFNLFGIRVKFKNDLPPEFIHLNADLNGAGVVSQLAYRCLRSNVFHWIIQLNSHVFVHEMGHALACKILTGHNSVVKIFYKRGGMTQLSSEVDNASPWKKSVIDVAGPMSDIAFCTCKMVAASVFKRYLSWPVALALGSGAAFCMSGELLYVYVSTSKKDDGDFGNIAKRGRAHLALASAVIISQCALGIFAVIKSFTISKTLS